MNAVMKKFLPRTANNPQGFTLVELMVVITIIAILSVVGVTVFTNVQKNARDSRRRQDIDAIVSALEANFASSSYPVPTAAMFANGSVPQDPLNTGTSVYTIPAAAGATYCVCALLENATGNATSTACGGLGTTTGTHYCKKNAQ